jgi:hypothetical protein
MILASGALQSEPATMDSCNAPMLPNEPESNIPQMGTSSAVRKSDILIDVDRAAALRRATFPVDRLERS